MTFLQTPIPLAEWVENITSWLTVVFAGVFGSIQSFGNTAMNGMVQTLLIIPPLIFIALIAIGMYLVSNRKIGLTVFTAIGLLYVYNQGLWSDLIYTLTLVIVATIISVILGIPLGILMAKNQRAENIITPILDFMQTMPSFVYLIPAVAFFGIGMVPGVLASVIFALPPTVRFTNLGINQIPTELDEASKSFGSTGWQKLFKLELPLAKQTIFAGINQTTMLALSMVVTASMIGAPGLGQGVLQALQRAEIGNGFVNGLSLVFLAIIIDRLTQKVNEVNRSASPKEARTRQRRILAVTLAVIIFLVSGTVYYSLDQDENTVILASVQWDSEIASSNVLKIVLEDLGYRVEISELDPAIMYNSIANGSADATLAPWLPNVQGFLYEEYGDRMVNLGANLEGAVNGIVVPSYMQVDSIADLTNEANKRITGIEPGAGITNMAENLMSDYENLRDWTLTTSSTGAMLVELDQAIANQEEIVITGWTPHWMFTKYDLKFLDDPELTMGDPDSIVSFARQGLEEDMPEVYRVIDNFNWTLEDMQSVMLEIQEVGPVVAAQNWIDQNPEKVASWLE
ncbi:MAG: ABC transporter permease subunit [Tissierella sp.]|nr:ABC transporter permease subunit [Tissierella sp.]